MSIPIALQLYSVREDAARDLMATLDAVAKMGYDGVEFAGYHGHEARAIRERLDANGLKACSTHIGLAALEGDALAATVDFHQTIGCDTLIVPGIPEDRRNSPETCAATAALFTSIAERLEPFGMRTGFHAHAADMKPLAGGTSAYYLIAQQTPESFIMQYDTANGMAGGADPVQPILDFPGRGKNVHLKEWSGEHGAKVIGEGFVPWSKVFEACETVAGTEWYIVEHEMYEGMSPMEAVAWCVKNLREMGK